MGPAHPDWFRIGLGPGLGPKQEGSVLIGSGPKFHPGGARVIGALGPKTSFCLSGPKHIQGQKRQKTVMEKVNLLLVAARLPVEAGYAEKFASHGYDDIQFVLGLTPSGLETLKEETNMPTGHFARLKEAILIWRKREYEPTSTPNTSPTPLNVSSDSVVNNSVGGPNAVAASASSEPSTSGGAPHGRIDRNHHCPYDGRIRRIRRRNPRIFLKIIHNLEGGAIDFPGTFHSDGMLSMSGQQTQWQPVQGSHLSHCGIQKKT